MSKRHNPAFLARVEDAGSCSWTPPQASWFEGASVTGGASPRSRRR